jgi:hypothetical protein
MATKPAATAPATERRIKDVESARKVYKRLAEDNKKRLSTYAQVSNQCEGGRPFDPAQQERDGLAWSTNVNFGDAEAAFDRTYIPYWKMAHDVPNRIATTVHTRAPDADKWNKGFAEAYDLFLDDWGADYFFQFMLFTADFVKFGPGYTMWADGEIPRFRHSRVESVLFPKRAKANPDTWEVVAMEDEMTASDLYEKVRTPKNAERSKYAGWNRSAIEQALSVAKNGGSASASDDFTRLQDDIVSNDIAISCEWAPVEVVRLFVKEYDGSICCYVFAKSADVKDFLYESKTFAKSFRNIIGPIFYSVGRGGLIHSIKGFAVKNFYLAMLGNRTKSRIFDALPFAMNLNMQRGTDVPEEQPPVEVYPGMNVLPPGLTQLTMYPQMQSAERVVAMLERNASDNNAMYREQRQQIGDTDTATQANLLAAMAAEMGTAISSIYLAQLGENIHKECFRRLRIKGSSHPDAVNFVRRCIERGIPRRVIHEAEVTVKTGASASTASAVVRDSIFKELMGLSNMPGFNRRWIQENYVANKLGAQAINRALLPEGTDSEPQARKIAIIENSVLGQGIELPVDPNEAHFEHIDEHLKPLEQIAGGYKQTQQISPEQVVALTMALPHVQQHFEFLQQDETRKDAYKVVWPRFSAVMSIANGIMSRLQKGPQQ